MLDEVFYESLIRHPLPVREAAIRALSGRSMAIDLYIWLAYRLHHLTRPTRVPWPALYRQFGAGFAQPRQLRAHAREALALALAAYPEARVGVEDDALTLMPSPAPVPERRPPAGRKVLAVDWREPFLVQGAKAAEDVDLAAAGRAYAGRLRALGAGG